MAEYFTKIAWAFDVPSAEGALLREVFDIIERIDCEEDHATIEADVSAAFWEVFPRASYMEHATSPFGSLLALFDDQGHCSLGLSQIEVEDDAETGQARVWLAGDQATLEALTEIIRRCCAATLSVRPIGFEWADDCSKFRLDAFGGGAVAIFHDRVEWMTGSDALKLLLERRSQPIAA